MGKKKLDNGINDAASFFSEKIPGVFDSSIYEKLIESLPVLIYVYNQDKVVYVNRTVEKVLGYTREEMMNFHFWDICHDDFKDLIRERGHQRLRGEEVPTNYEFKILKKNGEEIWVHVFFAVNTIAGEKVGIVGAYDVTESRQLKEALKKAHDELEQKVEERTRELRQKNQELSYLNENLNSIIASVSDGMLLVNGDGLIVPLNQALGRWQDELILALKAQLEEGKTSRLSFLMQQLLFHGRPFKDEEFTVGDKNKSSQFLLSGVPLRNVENGGSQGLVFVKPIREVHQLVNRFSGARSRFTFNDIITEDENMRAIVEFARSIARRNSSVLIEGESGTGKEMFAQAIHNASPRNNGPFVAVNCGAIPRELLGSELFGYVEGAFTGARKGGSPGKFELANGGTLFLDEIGDMPLEQQVALLRVLQEKNVMRIGGDRVIPVDVRIICASNKPLRDLVERGVFRSDLYYRLNVISLSIPPLRERPADIVLLFNYFLERYAEKTGIQVHSDVYRILLSYDWPGNVRELQNLVERIVSSTTGNKITLKDIPQEILQVREKGKSLFDYRCSKRLQKEMNEREEMLRLLDKYEGNITRCARELGCSRTTFYKKMKQYRL